MALVQVEVRPGQTATVNVVDGFPLGMREWAVLFGRLLDDATSLTITAGVVIELHPTVAALRVVIGGDGWFALAGRPLRHFPGLAAQPYLIRFVVHAHGYQSLGLLPQLPQQPGFPATFAPLAVGDVRLIPV
jgi:hypothetical protein